MFYEITTKWTHFSQQHLLNIHQNVGGDDENYVIPYSFSLTTEVSVNNLILFINISVHHPWTHHLCLLMKIKITPQSPYVSIVYTFLL
jgi:hypothetical protein